MLTFTLQCRGFEMSSTFLLISHLLGIHGELFHIIVLLLFIIHIRRHLRVGLDDEEEEDDDMKQFPMDTKKMTDEEKRRNFLERNRRLASHCFFR
jgi:hypothetical protein